MVQGLIDPALKDLFDLAEIANHAFLIQVPSADLYLNLSVMAVEIAAFSLIVQEPVTVAEVNFFRDVEHDFII